VSRPPIPDNPKQVPGETVPPTLPEPLPAPSGREAGPKENVFSAAFSRFRPVCDTESPEVSWGQALEAIPAGAQATQKAVQEFVDGALSADRDALLKGFGFETGASGAAKMTAELRELSRRDSIGGLGGQEADLLARMGGAYRDFQHVGGIFVSALLSFSEEESISLNLREFGLGLDYLCAFNGKKRAVTVEGDVGDYFGYGSTAGLLTVRGGAKDYAGSQIDGAKVIVEGDARYDTAGAAKSGWVHVGGEIEELGRYRGRALIVTRGPGEEVLCPSPSEDLLPEAAEALDPRLREPFLCPLSELRFGMPGFDSVKSVLDARRWMQGRLELAVRVNTADAAMSESVAALSKDEAGLDYFKIALEEKGGRRYYEVHGRRGGDADRDDGLTRQDVRHIAETANRILRLQGRGPPS
jgi:hypothetical protein